MRRVTFQLHRRQIEGYQAAYEAALLIATSYAALSEKRLKEDYVHKTLNCFRQFASYYWDSELFSVQLSTGRPSTSPLSMDVVEKSLQRLRESLEETCDRLKLL